MVPTLLFSNSLFKLTTCKKPPALTTCLICAFFSLAWLDCSWLTAWWNPRLLFLSQYCLYIFQDNPEYNIVLPFRMILKIFAVNMFASKLLSHGSTELDYQKSIKKCERKSVFGLFENLNISFSTGSAKKPTLYNWLFLSAI